jgi:hypothetical protein
MLNGLKRPGLVHRRQSAGFPRFLMATNTFVNIDIGDPVAVGEQEDFAAIENFWMTLIRWPVPERSPV